MKMLITALMLNLFLFSAVPAAKAEDGVSTTLLSKADIKTIKMFSTQEDKIVVFVTDHQNNKYRIGSMQQSAVEKLLDHIKNNDSVTLQAKKLDKKAYLEVVAWKYEPQSNRP